MNFNQDIHPIAASGVFDGSGCHVINRRHDNEDAIGAQRTRFGNLIRFVDEILPQDGQGCGAARCAEKLRSALERGLISQHRETSSTASLIGFSEP